MNKTLLAYTIDFASFLVDSLEEKDMKNIKEIILFGSVSKGMADKDSDVDIFINIFKKDNIERKVEKIKNDFYKGEIYKRWKLRGIDNEIKIIVDSLDKWKDLKISIISDGITLYSKYRGYVKGEQKVIIYWDKIDNESKRVLLSKKLYGYNYRKMRYKGLLELTSSEKIGSNCIITNLEDAKKILDIFKEQEITAKTIYVNKV